MGKVVVPQHQDGQSDQNHQAEQEVESGKVQQSREENERGDNGQVQLLSSAPQPGHTDPVRDDCSHLRQGVGFLRLPLQKPVGTRNVVLLVFSVQIRYFILCNLGLYCN